MASGSTGRPWQARVTPAITLLRLNGSVTPLRLTTDSKEPSRVLNRRPHSGQERRRRIAWPSSTSAVHHADPGGGSNLLNDRACGTRCARPVGYLAVPLATSRGVVQKL